MAESQYTAGGPRLVTKYEEGVIAESMREFSQMQLARNTTGGHWEEVAELILPEQRNTFFYGNYNWPGLKKTDRQVDATGMMALGRFAAILDSLLTPRNMMWHDLAPTEEAAYLMKNRQVRLWFEQARRILFRYRYDPLSNFVSQNQMNYKSLGAFGTCGMFIDELDNRNFGRNVRGLRYKSMPLGELFIRENHQGLVDGVIRWFRLTAAQAWQKWGSNRTDGKPSTFPEILRAPLEENSQMQFDFLHRIVPRDDYDPERLDDKGKFFASYYISIQGRTLLDDGGYRSFPIACSRYDQAPGETYGRSPAMQVLPALKTLNAQKRVFLKQAHRAVDPPLLIADDGVMDINLRPGAINKGGVTSDGKPLVVPLETGSVQIAKEAMAEEKQLINDAFLVTLFQILTETPQMTATEVVERTNEKGILLAPTVGRQQSEYLGPMIDRELDILANLGLLPPMPGLLKEAQGAYQTVYTSPLSRAMRAQEAAGFMRTTDWALTIVNATQDPSLLDRLDFDTAFDGIAEIQGVPPSWLASDEQVQARRKSRAQAQARQEQIQAAPAQAAMMKAQAVAAKSGILPGGGQQ